MRVLVTGASGLLGRYLLARPPEHATVLGWSGAPCEPVGTIPLTPVALESPRIRQGAYRMSRPDVVIHLAALSTLGTCFANPARARVINTEATAHLARLARADGALFVYASTDLVFDGSAPPYREDAAPNPLSIYGTTKLEGELAVLEAGGTVVRLSLLYGPGRGGRASFFDTMLDGLRTGCPVRLFRDEYRTPLDLLTAAEIFWALAERPGQGIVHAGGAERLSRLDMGRRLAAFLGLPTTSIHPADRAEVPGHEPRPADTALDSTRLTTLIPDLVRPNYEQSLERLFSIF